MDTPPAVTRETIFREVHLRDYWKIVWQARWTVLAVFVLVAGLTAVWTFLQTPIYRTTAIIEVQSKAQQISVGQDVSGLGAGSYGWLAEEKYHNTQVEIIRSRDVARRVAKVLDLESHPTLALTSDPVEVFRSMLQVVPRRETGLIEISMMGTDPEEITEWVNAAANQYVERNFEKARKNMDEAFRAVQSQLDTLETALAVAQSERFETLEQSDVVSSEHNEEIVLEKLRTYDGELTKANLELSQLNDTLQRIRALRQRNADLMSVPELAVDADLKELNRSKVDLERQLESAKVDLRPGHPVYEKTESELAKVRERIRDRVNVILGTLQNNYDGAREYASYLRQQISAAEKQSVAVARATSDYDQAVTQAETRRTILDMINRTMGEVQLGAQLLTNNVSLLDEATTPRYPIKPRKRLNMLIGMMLGVFFGLSAAFFLDYLDNTFRTPEDIEKYLQLAVLAVIPKAGEKGIRERAVKEAYQSLRTSVIFSSESRKRKVVVITSSGPQEGKSSTIANLARTLATAGDRVLVIDCDLRRPTQHLVHGMDREDGLTNYLASAPGSADWRDFIKETDPANLHILTCGPIPPSPPELLGSERFINLIDEAQAAYDWVLIDSPPAASLADTTQLAALADMVVLVVQHYRTDRDIVRKTVQRLQTVQTPIVGAVLNNVDFDRAYHKDYYYAGYYYSEDDDTTKRRRSSKKKDVGAGAG
jgi:capsular exopolysaccharide synthesis family protein